MIAFSKYQGAGNDFILVDDRDRSFSAGVAALCDRRFGIGADGLMLLRDHPDFDFEMVYYNSDGRLSTMCGNGGRCIVRFARDLGIRREEYRFLAVDGPHRARFEGEDVALELKDVNRIERLSTDAAVLDTGSPHYVRFVEVLPVDVRAAGAAIRNSEAYRARGINVNFVRRTEAGLDIVTFERGVEDETLACGTGVTAAVLAAVRETGDFEVPVRAKGGALRVRGRREAPGAFRDIWLVGPAEFVFRGRV